ncbi:MAG: hypothetical protein HXY19_04535 [Thermoanaerobaculaceae bacterium]|nr:hypothetical protein [Thermoanaerobaculaceae bacterium]
MPEKPTRHGLVVVALAALAAVAMVAVPLLPRGTDVYPHVLWTWQVQRCLAAGALPVWLPDLNAGFGSPGIRLYSPLGPLLSGALALALGDVGRGIRAALVLAAGALILVARRYRLLWAAPLLLLSPTVVFEAAFRFPVSQLLALPLLFLVLLRAASEEEPTWDVTAVLLACLWLLHALSAALALPLVALLSARSWRRLWHFALASLTAAALAAWHWLPLVAETRGGTFAAALTSGDLHPLRNLLGTPGAHVVDHNMALGWAAVGILAALLIGGVCRTLPALLAAGCVFMASLLATPLWTWLPILSWFQLPWRWLLPATVLALIALGQAPTRRRAAAAAALLAPLLAPPPASLVPAPALGARTNWVEAGQRVFASFEGNPLLVDVIEHRPEWWSELGPTIQRFGDRPLLLVPATAGRVRILEQRVTARTFTLELSRPALLALRVLFDPHFRAELDELPTPVERRGAAVAVAVPPGRHTLRVFWALDAASRLGGVVSLLTATALLAYRLHGRRRRAPAPPPP